MTSCCAISTSSSASPRQRGEVDALLGYVAGVPTYSLLAELAQGRRRPLEGQAALARQSRCTLGIGALKEGKQIRRSLAGDWTLSAVPD